MKVYHLYDFPDTIRILLKNNYRIEMFRNLLQIFGAITEIAKSVDVKPKTIHDFKKGKNSRNTDYFVALSLIRRMSKLLIKNNYKEFSMKNIEKQVVAYKTNSASNPILKPRLPLVEDERLIRIYTHLIGDRYGGGKYIRKTGGNFYVNPAYTNTNDALINRFAKDLDVFGKVPYDKRTGDGHYKVNLPMSIKYILEHIYNEEISASRGGLPKRFFKLSRKLKFEIIKAFCDDEGTVRDSAIIVSSGNKKQLEDIEKIMLSVKFNPEFIIPIKNPKSNLYTLGFRNQNFTMYGNKLGFEHTEKKKIMKFQLKRRANPKIIKPGESRKRILRLLEENPRTSLELAMRLGISQNTTGQNLRILANEEKIKRYRIPGKNNFEYSLS
ncbi:MAG: ArsR family transcriptional regulator [Nanoarchaeota archaeon]|nr:ArsR family transcriptional regulator [Nanoarchaeota archaeon]MBU4123852.1 ArsR family transcriptional regulator [Nanoarchaeota archaeon]